jgi:hypothetical protein
MKTEKRVFICDCGSKFKAETIDDAYEYMNTKKAHLRCNGFREVRQ